MQNERLLLSNLEIINTMSFFSLILLSSQQTRIKQLCLSRKNTQHFILKEAESSQRREYGRCIQIFMQKRVI